ncbi:protein polyglycylase TTLL10 isoform X1 [Solea solea]|uniref:protein polyglycylase TTLL10 isoform X1 n=2 Tax=Solea solea TaxID=90069 RepID=UPI00272C3426|nr:protein polyglycylase TTLL10 isoform X1 [Solea solea]XP_058497820.1 protein polyglycylase TTLL10 isoform X1 [Solea solea]
MLFESCSEGQGEDTRLEKKQDEGMEKEEVEVPRHNNTPSESKVLKEVPLDHSVTQGVIPECVLEQVQREEIQTLADRKRISHMNVNQESRVRGSGVCVVKQYLRRSFPRGVLTKDRERHIDEPRGPGLFYFFGGANGAEIVSSYLESKGWRRIYNKHREDFKIKWCETKSPVNYCNFREGEQLMYQIPNNKVLTSKIGLLSSLREYERVSSKVNHGRGLRRLKMEDFIPTTFRMDVKEERDAFFGVRNNESHMWICKPTGLNQGRGIFLLKSQEDLTAFRLKLQNMEENQANRRMQHCQRQARIVQHYIQSPLLLKGKKFDVRSYMLIACTAPFMVFFHHGYVRLTCDLYDPKSDNLSAHLTNQYMQKKNPLYSELKEDTVCSMENFNTYVNERFQVAKALPRDWVLGVFAKRMQRIMTQCFLAVKSKLDCRLGFFDLIGCDFMVDEDFKVWLLEMNCNPALHTNCEVLKQVIPQTVVETLDLTLEIFNKRRLRQRIFPLANQRDFVLLYNGNFPYDSALTCNKNKTSSELLCKTTNKTLKKTKARRCKSVIDALDDDCLNVSVSGDEAQMSSKTGHHPNSSSSVLFLNSSPVQRPINIRQTVRSKSHRPRVQLQLSKCTVHHHLKSAGDMKHPKTRVIMALSSSSQLRKGISVCGSLQTGLPVCEDPADQDFREETKSLANEREVEL